MKKFLAILFSLFLFTSTCFAATNSYDRYGSKTGSYKSNSSGDVTRYDKYGSKTGSYKKTSNGYNSYDKYGSKTGSYRTQGNTTTQYDKYGSNIKPILMA